MTKYIIPRHFPDEHADDYDFWIADDPQGKQGYFHVELYNIPYLEYLLNGDRHFKQEIQDIAAYERGYKALAGGALAYFIGNLYYADKTASGNGYDYLPIQDCALGGGTVFEVQNKNGLSPYSGTIYIAERQHMVPERVVWWMERLTKELFGEKHSYVFVNAPAFGTDEI